MAFLAREQLQRWWNSLDESQHVSLSFFIPCALVATILSIASLHASITNPFRVSKTFLTRSQQLIAQQRANAAEQARQDALKDTDGDGLSDADEALTFYTSPYLTDTDSDGVMDDAEIRAGTDPNCPPDRDCYGFLSGNPDGVPERAATSTQTQQAAAATPMIEPPRPPQETSPTEIRAYLIRNRLASEGQLSALPDDAVVELYRRAYADLVDAQTGASASSPPSEPSPTNP